MKPLSCSAVVTARLLLEGLDVAIDRHDYSVEGGVLAREAQRCQASPLMQGRARLHCWKGVPLSLHKRSAFHGDRRKPSRHHAGDKSRWPHRNERPAARNVDTAHGALEEAGRRRATAERQESGGNGHERVL